MSKIEEKARKAMLGLMVQPETIVTAKVLSVDAQKATCNVDLMDGRQRFDVRLRATEDNDLTGLIQWPTVGSFVLIGQIAKSKQMAVLQCSELDRITWKIDNTEMEANNTEVKFNGGTLGGMVKVNTLLTKINQLEARMNAHQHAYVSPSGAAVTTPNGTQTISPTTQLSDLENTKIKH